MKHLLAAGCAALIAAVVFAQQKTHVMCAVNTSHKAEIKKATTAKLFADYEGRRYYFCCEGCPPKFKKDPKKYAMNESVPSPTNPKVKCPVMPAMMVDVKAATKDKMFADYNGRRFYFCCTSCPALFKKEPAKFAKNSESLPIPKK